MKKCDKFKDLILTDFIDGRLDKNLTETLQEHLLDCADCRAFFREVKNNAVLPVQRAALQPVPAELWQRVQENIIEEGLRANDPLAGFIEKLKGILAFPRLVPVFASLVVMFLAGSVTLNTIHTQQAKDKEQGTYLVSLLSSTEAATVDNNEGTSIEHYFL
jgi:hypothetical protein